MLTKRWSSGLTVATLCSLTLCILTGNALSAVPDPTTSTVTATFANVYTGCYQTGLPKRHVTIAPGGAETLKSNGIRIEVVVRDAAGLPCVGIPAAAITLDHPSIAWCPGGNVADGPTDAMGRTTFSGYLCGGGSAPNLTVYVGGVAFGTVDVKTNSPDFAHLGTSPGFIDASDLAAYVAIFPANLCGGIGAYDIGFDFNEDGGIDASDLSAFAAYFTRNCTAVCP